MIITRNIIHGYAVCFTYSVQCLPRQYHMANPPGTATPDHEQQYTNKEYSARRQHSNKSLYIFRTPWLKSITNKGKPSNKEHAKSYREFIEMALGKNTRLFSIKVHERGKHKKAHPPAYY